MNGPVDRAWESFAMAVMPRGAPSDQVREMCRAFYAGAWAVLTETRAIGGDDVTEERGVERLEAMVRDCERFAARVGADR